MGDVEGCFGSGSEVVWEDFWSLVRWFVRSIPRFVRPLVRSFVRASKELYKKTSAGVSA